MIDRHVGEAVQSALSNHNAPDAGNEPGFRDILAVDCPEKQNRHK